ncbi:hypothetical protein HDU98_007577 [Podochytrium sp. JEL0797]|nr:hypothetical protein HDU98_007577 [Podochytrium sp. JEL0797]
MSKAGSAPAALHFIGLVLIIIAGGYAFMFENLSAAAHGGISMSNLTLETALNYVFDRHAIFDQGGSENFERVPPAASPFEYLSPESKKWIEQVTTIHVNADQGPLEHKEIESKRETRASVFETPSPKANVDPIDSLVLEVHELRAQLEQYKHALREAIKRVETPMVEQNENDDSAMDKWADSFFRSKQNQREAVKSPVFAGFMDSSSGKGSSVTERGAEPIDRLAQFLSQRKYASIPIPESFLSVFVAGKQREVKNEPAHEPSVYLRDFQASHSEWFKSAKKAWKMAKKNIYMSDQPKIVSSLQLARFVLIIGAILYVVFYEKFGSEGRGFENVASFDYVFDKESITAGQEKITEKEQFHPGDIFASLPQVAQKLFVGGNAVKVEPKREKPQNQWRVLDKSNGKHTAFFGEIFDKQEFQPTPAELEAPLFSFLANRVVKDSGNQKSLPENSGKFDKSPTSSGILSSAPTSANDEDIAKVLSALYKSATKGSVASARLLRRLVSIDEELSSASSAYSSSSATTEPHVHQSPKETAKSVQKPLASLFPKGNWKIFEDMDYFEQEIEPVSPFLKSLQDTKNNLSNSILSKFMTVLASPNTPAGKDDGKIFASYFEEADKDTSGPASLSGFLNFTKTGGVKAKEFLANLGKPPKGGSFRDTGNIFVDFGGEQLHDTEVNSFKDYLLRATNQGSSSSADIFSQLVDFAPNIFVTQTPRSQREKQPDRPKNTESPVTRAEAPFAKPQQAESWTSFMFEDSNKFHSHESEDLEDARLLKSLKSAATQGNQAANYLFSKLSLFDKMASKGSDPKLSAVIDKMPILREQEYEPVAPLLLSIQNAVAQGDSVASSLLRSFFGTLVSSESKSEQKAAKEVFNDYFEETKKNPTHDAEPMDEFLKFVEGLMRRGSKSAKTFMNEVFLNGNTRRSNEPVNFRSMFTDSIRDYSTSESVFGSGLKDFVNYISRMSSHGNTASTGLLAEMLVSTKEYKDSNGPIFIPQEYDPESLFPKTRALDLLKSISTFSFDNPSKPEQKGMESTLSSIKKSFVTFPADSTAFKSSSEITYKNSIEVIKSKWDKIMSARESGNILNGFFVDQTAKLATQPNPEAETAGLLGSLEKAAIQGSDAAEALLSKLTFFDKLVSQKTEPPLAKIVNKLNQDNQNVWVQQEPVAPLVLGLKSSIGYGDVLASEVLRKFFNALTMSGPSSSSKLDSQVFREYFESEKSGTSGDAVESFLSFVKGLVQSGSRPAASFASSLSDILVNGKSNYQPASFDSIFTDALEKDRVQSIHISPISQFVNYLTKSSARGNPASAGLLAELLVSSNITRPNNHGSIFADDFVGVLSDISRVSLENPSSSISRNMTSAFKRVKSELSNYLVGQHPPSSSREFQKRPIFTSDKVPKETTKQAPGAGGLKGFFVNQNYEASSRESLGAASLLSSMANAAIKGSKSAETLLTSLFDMDKQVSLDSEPFLESIWSNFSSEKVQETWFDEPVSPLIQSLKKASESGNVVAAGLIKKFFQALASPEDKDPSVRAADQIFANYFAQQSLGESNDKEPIDKFLDYLESIGSVSSSAFLSSLFKGKHAKDPKFSFQGIFEETVGESTASHGSSAAISDFFNYLYRVASAGSPTASSFLSDILVTGHQPYTSSKTDSFRSIFNSEPKSTGFLSKSEEPKFLLKLLANIGKLASGKSSSSLQHSVASGLKTMKSQLKQQGGGSSIFVNQDQKGAASKVQKPVVNRNSMGGLFVDGISSIFPAVELKARLSKANYDVSQAKEEE